MKPLVRILFASFILSNLFAGCMTAPHDQSPEIKPDPTTARYSESFKTTACWFEVPVEAEVTCGYVTVPEDRSKPLTEKNTIRLAVAFFHAKSETPAPDPILYHVGGPGGHMLDIVPHIYDKVIAPFLETRDLILFDPRGTGFSQPALECKNGEDPGDCVRRLFAEGHDLYAYNSLTMAEDLQDIRAALGYDQWNLLGESYGTHVAQVTLREASEGLRSVIIDSVMPIVIPDLPNGRSSFEVALQRLFERCEEDPACITAYPNLPNALQTAVQRLNAEPESLKTTCYGEEKSALLTGDRLVSMVFHALYETEMIPMLPYAISSAADGTDYSFWNNVVCWEAVIDVLLTDGAHLAMQCGDGRLGNECEDWPVAVEQSPVTSEIPVLILSGEFDPVTPLEYGHSVAQGLSRGFVFDFPGMGHWVNGTGHPCQIAIIQAFLDDPAQEPDAGCVQDLPNWTFHIPEQAGAPLLGSYAEMDEAYKQWEAELLERGRQVSQQIASGDTDSLYNRFSTHVRQEVSFDAWQEVVEGLSATAPIGERIADRVLGWAYLAEHVWGDNQLELSLSFDEDGLISGIEFTPLYPLPDDPRATYTSDVSFRLPFDGLWYVAWGGPDELHNYHVAQPVQRYAYDFFILQDGSTHSGEGTDNSDYYAFGQLLLAPSDGVVVEMVNDQPDQAPGVIIDDFSRYGGNYIILKVAEGEYILMAHLQQGSVMVEEGEWVEQGQPIGRVGNSGHTTEAHLHIQLQDTPRFMLMGAHCLPLSFSNYVANGQLVEKGVPLGGQFVEALQGSRTYQELYQ